LLSLYEGKTLDLLVTHNGNIKDETLREGIRSGYVPTSGTTAASGYPQPGSGQPSLKSTEFCGFAFPANHYSPRSPQIPSSSDC